MLCYVPHFTQEESSNKKFLECLVRLESCIVFLLAFASCKGEKNYIMSLAFDTCESFRENIAQEEYLKSFIFIGVLL